MFVFYNPNPVSGEVGDCAVRALTKALGVNWEEAYLRLCVNGYLMADMPSSDIVWGAVLRSEGWRRHMIPDLCPDCYTIADFCREHPKGVYVIKSENHVCTAVSGDVFDTWDSTRKVPYFYWTKEEE